MTRDTVLHVLAPAGQQTFRFAADAAERTLSDTLRRAGLPLNTRCGERGLCQGCQVELIAGQLWRESELVATPPDAAPRAVQGCYRANLCRLAGAERARIDSVIGCDTPSPSPSTNDRPISASSERNDG